MYQLWCCGAIVWGVTLVGGMLGSVWSGVLELVERFLCISWNGDFQYAYLVVPVQCDSIVYTPCPILCALIFFLECLYEVQCVLLSLVFYSKVVDY